MVRILGVELVDSDGVQLLLDVEQNTATTAVPVGAKNGVARQFEVTVEDVGIKFRLADGNGVR